ncbi:MAG: hypothetical protein GF311_13230 [Candidatus Lokiarchaeota archaeon]|nr:hypothetical protein [Candidatus Lokiarchaeota archaeon]
MTTLYSEKERNESVISSKRNIKPDFYDFAFNISKYTLPFSYFKMDSRFDENSRKNNIKKLAKYSEEFKNILKKELL